MLHLNASEHRRARCRQPARRTAGMSAAPRSGDRPRVSASRSLRIRALSGAAQAATRGDRAFVQIGGCAGSKGPPRCRRSGNPGFDPTGGRPACITMQRPLHRQRAHLPPTGRIDQGGYPGGVEGHVRRSSGVSTCPAASRPGRGSHVTDTGSRESTTGLTSQGVAWSSPAGSGGGVEKRSEAGPQGLASSF